MSAQIFFLDRERDVALSAATAAVNAGGCIVLPTDTVYGIGADPFRGASIDRLLAAKGRGRDMPVPVLISDPEVMPALAREVPNGAQALARAYWPGALSLILPVQPSLAVDVGDTQDTIMVRVPDHEDVRALLRKTGPLGVSSANSTGEPPAQTASDALRMLGNHVAVYLDGGATPGQTPSTIVDFAASPDGVVRRLGALGLDELRRLVPTLTEA